MENFFIETEDQKYIIHYSIENNWYSGNVYPITEWTHLPTGKTGWSYESHSFGGDTHEELNEDCRCLFAFNFVWRGVWEGRIYFKDDEYWSEEIRMMADLWDKIEIVLKDKIKKSNTEYSYDD